MNKSIKKTTATLLIAAFMISMSVVAIPVIANDFASSTMHFYGTLTDEGGGVYTGIIPMTAGEYYVPGGAGEAISTGGGFDLLAKEGGTAYVENYYGTGAWNDGGTDTYVIGYYKAGEHDAYPQPGGPWGGWYDPDCADWDQYSLELTADHWYLRYTTTMESPLSGEMTWLGGLTGYAKETDQGTDDTTADKTDPVNYPYPAGSPQEWGWNCGWGEERIPLEYPGFEVVLVYDKDGNYFVELTPAPLLGQVGMSAKVEQKFVSITVDPLTVDFGTLIEGEASSDKVTVTNHGNVAALVTASLIDEVPEGFYAANLQMDVGTVASWSIPSLAKEDSQEVDLVLTIPSPAAAGPKTATLVFWAEIA